MSVWLDASQVGVRDWVS